MAMLPDLSKLFAAKFGLNRESPPLLPKLVPGQGVNFATKAAELQRAIEEAKALRAKGLVSPETGSMVSGHYVPNYGGMLAGLGAGLLGQSREKDLAAQAAELAAAQQAEQSRLMGELPTGQAAIPATEMGPPQDVPVDTASGDVAMEQQFAQQPGQAAKPPTMQEMAAWAAKMQGVNPKLAEGVTNKIIEGQLDKAFAGPKDKYQVVGGRLFNTQTEKFEDMPMSEADREKAAQAKELKLAEIEQRAEAARLRSEDMRLSVEQRRQASAESAALRRELAAGNAELRRELAGGKDGKLSKKEQEKANLRTAQKSGIMEVVALLDDPETEAAFGQKQGLLSKTDATRSWAQSKLTDKQSTARNRAMNIAAEFIHSRYGAALSQNERDVAMSYLPAPSDSRQVVQRKLRDLVAYLDSLDLDTPEAAPKPAAPKAAPGAAPKAAAKPMSDADLLKQYGGK